MLRIILIMVLALPVLAQSTKKPTAPKASRPRVAEEFNPEKLLVDLDYITKAELEDRFDKAYANYRKFHLGPIFAKAVSGKKPRISASRLFGHCAVESLCNPLVKGGTGGSVGLFQIKPDTADQYDCGPISHSAQWGANCAATMLAYDASRVTRNSDPQVKVEVASMGYQPGLGRVSEARDAAEDCDLPLPKGDTGATPKHLVKISVAVWQKKPVPYCDLGTARNVVQKLTAHRSKAVPYWLQVEYFKQKLEATYRKK
jgi:hypothetical protein